MNEPGKGSADGQLWGKQEPSPSCHLCSAGKVEVRLSVAREGKPGAGAVHIVPLQVHHSVCKSLKGGWGWGHMSLWLQQVKLCLAAVSSPLPAGIQIKEDLFYQLGPDYSAVAGLVCRDCSLLPVYSCNRLHLTAKEESKIQTKRWI